MASRSTPGGILIGLLGTVFALIGAGMAWQNVSTPLENERRVRTWEEVPATLLEARRQQKRLSVRYRYEYRGAERTGERVGFYDNHFGGPFEELRREQLSAFRARLAEGGGMTVWVNPQNPGEALIDRRILWPVVRKDLLGPGFLCAIGLIFAFLGFFIIRDHRKTAEELAAALGTKQPLHGGGRGFPLGSWLMALVWNGAVLLTQVSGMKPAIGAPRWVGYLVIGALGAIGLLLLLNAARATFQTRRYGGIALDLDPFPGVIGGALTGTLVVPISYGPSNQFTATLSAVEHGSYRGPGGSSRISRRILFREKATVAAQKAPGGTRLEVRFALPAAAPVSEGYGEPVQWTIETKGRKFIRWTLAFEAARAGFEEEFEIPVVKR
ncbi:MAG: DUF3592 domain-containing protein [Betaproteobacteria bacterium]|nr:MAG: DUF3592 domain-containing protein [Betaproteobacteria bacterium]